MGYAVAVGLVSMGVLSAFSAYDAQIQDFTVRTIEQATLWIEGAVP